MGQRGSYQWEILELGKSSCREKRWRYNSSIKTIKRTRCPSTSPPTPLQRPPKIIAILASRSLPMQRSSFMPSISPHQPNIIFPAICYTRSAYLLRPPIWSRIRCYTTVGSAIVNRWLQGAEWMQNASGGSLMRRVDVVSLCIAFALAATEDSAYYLCLLHLLSDY
jgi:hypothetical protein